MRGVRHTAQLPGWEDRDVTSGVRTQPLVSPPWSQPQTGNGEPASFLGSRRTSWWRQASEGRRNSLGPRWPWEAPADSILFRGTDCPLPPPWVSVSAAQAQEHSGSRGRARRKRGHQRMRWLNGITDAMNMNLAQVCGIFWDQGLIPALARRFLTSGPPGKSHMNS